MDLDVVLGGWCRTGDARRAVGGGEGHVGSFCGDRVGVGVVPRMAGWPGWALVRAIGVLSR